jgi:hypothetical protein
MYVERGAHCGHQDEHDKVSGKSRRMTRALPQSSREDDPPRRQPGELTRSRLR